MPKPKTSSAKPSHNKSSKSAKASTGKRGKRPSSAVVGGTSPAAAAAPKPRRAAGADQAQPHLNNNNNFSPADVGTKSPPSEPMTARPLSAPLQRRTSSTIYSHNVSPPVAHTPQTISINRPRSNTNTNVTAATSTTTMEDRQISTSPPPRPPAATPSSRPRTPPVIPARADGSRGPHEDGVVARYASLRPIESVSPRPRPHSSMHQLTGQALTAAMLAQQQQQQPPQQQGDVEQPDVSPAPAFCSGLTEFQAREVLSDKDSGSLNSSFSDSPRSPHRSALPTQRSVILSTSMAAGSISNLRCETSMLGSPRGEAAEALRMQRCMDATRRLGDTSEVAHLIHNAHTKAPLHEEELRPTHRPTSASGTTAGTPGVPRLALAQSSRRSQQEQDEGRAQAIRGLSLYDAFILDRQRKVWVVDDRVLAKCLDYLRLMGYTHPQLKRDRAKGVPSLWSSSAVIPSPLISAQQQQQQQQQQQDQEQSQDKDEVRRPYALRHPPSSEASRHGALFLTQAEAMRWVSEQEYVLGTILLCCAKAGRRGAAPTPDDEVLGCIPPKTHPILFTAELILKSYPQWGTFESFLEVWERQVRLVLCPAAPAHQRSFSTFDGITFSSDMEGGNLQRVERAAESGNYYLWLDPDLGSDKRIWFRFAVVGAKEGRILHFRLLNAAPHAKLYKQNGMCPVWRDGASVAHWTAVEQCQFRLTPSEDAAELQFSIIPRSSTDTIQVAFCPPYTYADLLCHISQWHMLVKTGAANIRFEERVLCRSPDGRKLHLLVLTSPTQSTTSPQLGRKIVGGSAFSKASLKARGAGGAAPASPLLASVVSKAMVERPYSNFASGKKVVLISGRVHPGEITASHALHGIITFLLSSHPRAIALREHFLFFIIPMINPDGVSRGHSRMDQYGINLNRCYNDPEPTTQPTVLALKNVFDHLQRTFRERFIMYLDFHSHASQSSGFIFGNYLPNTVQPFNMGYTKLVELHSRKLFAFSLCRFGRGHMTSKDGTSRVLFGCGLVHSYTVELTHFTDRRLYADTIEAINSGDSVVRGGEDAAGAAGGKAGAEAKKGGKAAAGGARGSVVVSNNNNNSSSAPEVRSRYPSAGKAPSSQSGRKVESLKKHRSEVIPTKLKDRMRLPISVRQSTASATTSMEKEGSSERKASTFVPRRREGKSGPTLACITFPSILRQSAMVGEACMLALHDYCLATARPSQELVSYGGYEKVMAEMKAHIRESSRGAGGKKSPVKYAIQPIFKQY